MRGKDPPDDEVEGNDLAVVGVAAEHQMGAPGGGVLGTVRAVVEKDPIGIRVRLRLSQLPANLRLRLRVVDADELNVLVADSVPLRITLMPCRAAGRRSLPRPRSARGCR